MHCKKLALIISTALPIPALALADGLYVSAQLGANHQVGDAEPLGNNIAADDDFPASFDAESGTVAAIGLGYAYSDKLRFEGRISNRQNNYNDRKLGTGARDGEEYILDGGVESTSITLQGFYSFPNRSSVTPYVTAGLGISDNKYSARLGGAGVAAFDAFDGVSDGYYDAYSDGDSTEFTWNVGVGGSVILNEYTAIYGEYQYASYGDVSTGQDSFTDGFEIDDITSSEIVLGIRISF